jgi:hypothetical protein
MSIHKSRYDTAAYRAILRGWGLPEPTFEHTFAPPRRWRFDMAWPRQKVAVEIEGGLWVNGRHNRGAALVKDFEKRNAAAELGWRILWTTPDDITKSAFLDALKAALELELIWFPF